MNRRFLGRLAATLAAALALGMGTVLPAHAADEAA